MLMQSLGRLALLGDMYNARTETLTRTSILADSIVPEELAAAVTLDEYSSSNIAFNLDDSYKGKTKFLQLSPDLQASFLAGLPCLEGSGKYLEDASPSAHIVRVALKYTISTKTERLNLSRDHILHTLVTAEFLENASTATHVVCGIAWGANMIAIAEYNNQFKDDPMEIASFLQIKLQDAVCKGLGAKTHKKTASDLDNQFHEASDKNITLKIYSDMALYRAGPQTVEIVQLAVGKMASLVRRAHLGKGKPVAFYLLPIGRLQELLGIEDSAAVTAGSCRLTEVDVIELLETFDEILRAKQYVGDLLTELRQFPHYRPGNAYEEVGALKVNLEKYEVDLRCQVAVAVLFSYDSNKET